MHYAPARFASQAALLPRTAPPSLDGLIAMTLVVATGAAAVDLQAAQQAPVNSTPELPAVKKTSLKTSDKVDLAVWYYAAREGSSPLATVLLLHDLGGSHETVEPLALALQEGGCAVVVPDLRGHGDSVSADLERAAGNRSPSDLLKLPDFKAMIATGGGRVRDQASLQGDIECVRNWIKEQSVSGGGASLDRLYLVGSGLGGALAAHWTFFDAAWPPLASGPQGGDVKGLVLIEPAFAAKQFQILPALASEPIKTELPIMIIAGKNCRDADKVFDPLKRWRTDNWFDSRRPNDSPAKDSEATLLFAQLDARDGRGATVGGDQLASWQSPDRRRPDPASLIVTFIRATSDR